MRAAAQRRKILHPQTLDFLLTVGGSLAGFPESPQCPVPSQLVTHLWEGKLETTFLLLWLWSPTLCHPHTSHWREGAFPGAKHQLTRAQTELYPRPMPCLCSTNSLAWAAQELHTFSAPMLGHFQL